MRKTLWSVVVAVALLSFTGTAHAGPMIVVYDGGGPQASIPAAMTALGYAYVLRDPGNPVIAADLVGSPLLVIGWNYAGDMSGVPASVVGPAITGNIVLTGHDADYHTVHGPGAALTFLDQAIQFAMAGGGTGLVALGDYSTAFTYLPAAWGITAVDGLLEETITAITAAGMASGVYTGLTPALLSNWGQSYHARFTAWDPRFVPFEYGGGGDEVVTLGYIIPEPGTLLLFGGALLVLGGLRRFRKK